MTKKDDRVRFVESLDLDPCYTEVWHYKWVNLNSSARKKGVVNRLTFEQFVSLAKEAGLRTPDQIGVTRHSYQLGRIGDSGDYTIGSCRFITQEQNLQERKLNGGNASISNTMKNTLKSEEHRRRLKEFNSKRSTDDEFKAKMSLAMKDYWAKRKAPNERLEV